MYTHFLERLFGVKFTPNGIRPMVMISNTVHPATFITRTAFNYMVLACFWMLISTMAWLAGIIDAHINGKTIDGIYAQLAVGMVAVVLAIYSAYRHGKTRNNEFA